MLLLRGDLIRHFPRPGIVLVQAQWARDAAGAVRKHPDGRAMREPVPMTAAAVRLPIFSGRLDPDVLFLGFGPSEPRSAAPRTRPATLASS